MENIQVKYGPEIENFYPLLETLSGDKRVLFVTTSNRGDYVTKLGEEPKSNLLAKHLAKLLKERDVEVDIIDASKLKIYPCLGCVSELHGNACGVNKSKVKDEKKNPHGHLKCWASHDYKDDEIWKIANSLYESDSVVFFASNRWGNPNAIYQKLIERLDWIESSHTTHGGKNTVQKIKSGMVILGQNWRVKESLEVQYAVHEFFGFKMDPNLYIGWQYTRDVMDEADESYKNAPLVFTQSTGVNVEAKEKSVKENLSDKGTGVLDFQTFLLNELKWK